MNYGLPYRGSKNLIARWVVDHLPPADCFVDLFAGGCAVTHAAILSGKYKRFIVNDIEPLMPRAFVAAINGAFRDERRVITREEFEALKATDPYVAICWSFGNNGQDYLWNEDTARIKLLACHMLMDEAWQERRQWWLQFVKELKSIIGFPTSGNTTGKQRAQMCIDYIASLREPKNDDGRKRLERLQRLQSLESLERLERLQNLQSLQSLESLERLKSLERTCPRVPIEVRGDDYRDFDMPDGSVLVYCDPPYKGTDQYRCGQFDSEAFHAWAATRPNVVISEYDMPADSFKCIAEVRKSVRMAATGTGKTHAIERLFVPRCSPLQEYKQQNDLFDD